MKYRTRIYYTGEQKALMWDHWQAGDSLHEIARLFNRHHSSVRGIFERCGGMRPPTRRRSTRSLTLAEREEISRGIAARRRADQATWDRARRPKICKLARHRALARLVAARLKLQWSPEEIAGWLRRTYPHNENRQVSHETIYKTLFIQARGALKKELLAHLRLTKAMRHPRGHTQKNRQIKEAVSIRERPAEAEDRAVPGHWEGDLLIGSNNSQIATLVERQTRYCMLVRVKSKHTETVIDALIKQAHKLPRELYKSLTWDRGKEMADHKRFSLATDIKVYFCDPQSPWQRGSNEQINGLLRQYFPKGMDLSEVHQNRLNAVAKRLNERPRKTLGYYSPAEKFAECVASTG
jgi:IS30 family transposase